MTEIKVGDVVKLMDEKFTVIGVDSADRQVAIQHEDGHLQIVHMMFLRPCDNRERYDDGEWLGVDA